MASALLSLPQTTSRHAIHVDTQRLPRRGRLAGQASRPTSRPGQPRRTVCPVAKGRVVDAKVPEGLAVHFLLPGVREAEVDAAERLPVDQPLPVLPAVERKGVRRFDYILEVCIPFQCGDVISRAHVSRSTQEQPATAPRGR